MQMVQRTPGQPKPPIRLPERDLGEGLLPPALFEDADGWVLKLAEAYAAIKGEKEDNFRTWHGVRLELVHEVQHRYAKQGYTAPALYEDRFWKGRIDLEVPSKESLAHVQLVRALLTPYQGRFCQHIRQRLRQGGNVHLSIGGPTGMAKSSCAGALAHWIKPIEPARLIEHFSFDLTDLPQKLSRKEPGDTVVQDEFTQGAGEGASTTRALFQNLEDTLRASQVNLIRVSPREQETGTMQAHLELLFWDPPQDMDADPKCPRCLASWRGDQCACGWEPSSLFLVWLDGVPMGVIALPWMSAAHFAVYAPWKRENTARATAGQFKDKGFLVKTMMEYFANPDFVSFFMDLSNKPKAGDFETGFEIFPGPMLATSQLTRMKNLAHALCYAFQHLEAKFERIYGVAPNAGFREVALKCYQE